MSYDEFDNEIEDINRIRRHKRRVRNRLIAIIVFILILALIATGIWFGVSTIMKNMATKASIEASISASESAASASEEEDINSIIDSLLSEEEEVVDPEETEEEEKTPEELLDMEITNMISQMSIPQKVAGLFIISPEELSDVELAVKAGEGTQNALAEYPVGGLVYSADNILSKEQFEEMMANTESFAQFNLFTCLDEGFSQDAVLASKLEIDATKPVSEILESMDPYNAFLESSIIAKNLSDYKVNTNIGLHNLTIDIKLNEDGTPAETEEKALFGNDWIVAGQMASQSVAALKEKNIFSFVGKFPNPGTASEDSAKRTSELSKEAFAENGLHVFNTSVEAGVTGIVIGNVYLPNMTNDDLPASLSKEFITDYMRLELGYTDVVLITDKLSNPEISDYYSSAEACVMAIKAGADMVSCPESFKDAYVGILEAVTKGEISEERINQSLKRIMKYKYAPKNTEVTEGELNKEETPGSADGDNSGEEGNDNDGN